MSAYQHLVVDDGCRIAWRLDGPANAPVLMLSNSLGTDMTMWDAQMPAFTRTHRVLRYDSRGHGRSGSPAGAYSMDRLGRDALQVLDALGLEAVHFCGLSKGGMVGQWLGARAPERIHRLVLANTAAFMGPPSAWQARIQTVLASGMAPLAQASATRWFSTEFAARDPVAVGAILRVLEACDPHGYAGCCAAIRDMDLRLTAPLVSAPTLVIAGSRDPSTSVEDGRWLAQAVQRGRLLEVDAAHLSNVETPLVFAEAVLEHLGADAAG